MATLEPEDVSAKAESPLPMSGDEGAELSAEKKAELDAIPMDKVAQFLRKKVRTEEGVTDAKRVEYFRGLAAVKCLVKSGQWSITKKKEAVYLLERLLAQHEYFHQAAKTKTPSGAKRLAPVAPKDQVFLADQTPYIWTYEVSSWLNTILGVGVLLAVFAGTLFPLWPQQMRDGVWWVSMACVGLIGLFFATCIVRLILFVLVWVVSGGRTYFWLYPNLLRDDDDFWGSFKPWYSVSHKQGAVSDAKKSD